MNDQTNDKWQREKLAHEMGFRVQYAWEAVRPFEWRDIIFDPQWMADSYRVHPDDEAAFQAALEKAQAEEKQDKGTVVFVSCNPKDTQTPEHYNKPAQPWDLERCMETSGNAFVDARRTDAIEYCFRKKDDMLGDLKKAMHCIQVAIEELERQNNE